MAAPTLREGGHQYSATISYAPLHMGDHIGDTHNYAPKESLLNKILRNLVSISGRDEIVTQYTRRTVEGTCDWLITVPDSYYLAWRESNKSDGLWVSGKPGKGKTMLAVHLLNHLREASSDDDVLLYFFCKNEHGDRNKTDVILRDLSNQLLHREPGLVDHIRAYFSPAPQGDNPPICNTTYVTIFETLVRHSASSITCVLDGLDECDESEAKVEEFLMLLGDIARKAPSSSSTRNFKLLIVGRDWPPCMNRQLGWCQRINLDEVEEKRVEKDVEKYIAQKLHELAVEHEQYRLPEHRLEHVRQVLTDKSDGTFLWAGYVADEIKGKTWTEANNILMRVPKGLDGLYLRMLRAIKDRAQDSVGTEMVASILQWVVLSQRPLTIDELAAATKPVDSDQLSHEETVSDVIKLCGRFFEVGDTITFLHQSARDYLLQGKDKFGDNDLAVLLVDEKRGHVALANTCLTHIETDFQRQISRGPLFKYAAIYWPEHLKHVSTTPEEVLDLSRPFWHKRSAIQENWSRYYRIERGAWVFAWKSFSPMQFAAYFGIVPLVEKLIEINSKLDAIGDDERTPFLFAAEMGHEKVATMLLDKGANVNAVDSYGRTALHWATITGHKSMMVKLLDSGAKLESWEIWGGTPLAEAIENGCPDVIEILLKGGAKVNYLYELPPWLDSKPQVVWHEKFKTVQYNKVIQTLLTIMAIFVITYFIRYEHMREALSQFNNMPCTALDSLQLIAVSAIVPLLITSYASYTEFISLERNMSCLRAAVIVLTWNLLVLISVGMALSVSSGLQLDLDLDGGLKYVLLFALFLTSVTNSYWRIEVQVRKRRRSPLLRAVENENRDMVKMLLEYKAKPDFNSFVQPLPQKPLNLAIQKGYKDIIRDLQKAS